ncbi:hypothetical protein EVC37_24355 [Methylocaldum sp. BRCS4]|nr:hypothetical protein [Methylocaldum sp. BRCS4]
MRFKYAGTPYHITARGDQREDIFFPDEDRRLSCSDSENPANPGVKELSFVPQPSLWRYQ